MKFYFFEIILLFCFIVPHAQLCNDNLGDPIVNVTFGIKGNPQIPSVTSYQRVGGCPGKGQYTINDFLFGCGGNWLRMIGDHTPGDLDGNYMLVDAESTPGIVHQDTASGLCENMIYQYSFYVANALQDDLSCGSSVVLPNLTLIIESLAGKTLASYSTGDIPLTKEKEWVQYGFTYKTTQGIDAVVLKIISNSIEGCGSVFAVDDIVFQNCGPSVNVSIDGTTADQKVCADYSNPFEMQGSFSAGFTDPVVQWQNSFDTGKTWNDIQGANTTFYKVPHRVSGVVEYRMVVAERGNINSVNCRIRSNSIYTAIYPIPPHTPPQFINGCTGKDYRLPSNDYAALEIEWTGPNGFFYNSPFVYSPVVVPNLTMKDTGLYILKQTFYFGCVSVDSFYLAIATGINILSQSSHALCEGGNEMLSITTSGTGSFQWSPSIGLSDDAIKNPIASPKDSTLNKVIVTNSSGCSDSAFLPVYIYRKPVADAGEDKTIIIGDSTILNGSVKGTSINYSWSPLLNIDNLNSLQPRVYPVQDMVYTLTAISNMGCGSASDNVNVKAFRDYFIPNAFSPNSDGVNDRFKIPAYNNYTVVKFIIYNRWGTVLFKSNTPGDGWDGTFNNIPQPTGSYIYFIQLLDKNNKKIIKQGTVSIIR